MSYDEAKFAALARMLADAKREGIEVVVVAQPDVLGDDYEELIENLWRIGEAGIAVRVVGSRPAGGTT